MKKPASKKLELPARHRVGPAPTPFVGRRRERLDLARAIRQAQVTVIWGAGGMGKTSLVKEVLHRRFAGRLPRTLLVSALGADSSSPALEIARSLQEVSACEAPEWRGLLGDEAALAAFALEVAEAHGLWVVLDDFHLIEAAAGARLIAALARGARASRWIVTRRSCPRRVEGGEVSVLELAPLGEPALRRLARALLPATERARIAEAIQEAEGSPTLLRRALLYQPPTPGVAARQAGRLLGVLTRMEVPLPIEALQELLPDLPDESLACLRDRGFLEETASGVRLNERALEEVKVGGLAPGPGLEAQFAGRAAELLEGLEDAASQIEALRLYLQADRPEAAGRLLEHKVEALLAAGHAPRLWALLGGGRSQISMAARWRLRIAAELGDDRVLSEMVPPSLDEADPELRYLWARILWLRGEMKPCGEQAARAAVAASRRGDEDLAFRAGLQHAQCVASLGGLGEALSLLEALRPPDAESQARHETLAVMVFSLLGRADEAMERIERLRTRLSDLAWPNRGIAAMGLARALSNLGHNRAAAEVLDSALQGGPGQSAAFETVRQILYIQGCHALEVGHLDVAEQRLARIEPYLGRRSLMRPYVDAARAFLRIQKGDLAGIDSTLALIAADARERANDDLVDEVEMLQARLANLRCEGSPRAELKPLAPETSPFVLLRQTLEIEQALRRGVLDPGEVAGLLDPSPSQADPAFKVRLLRALARLLGGDAEAAGVEAARIARDAGEGGYALWEVQALQLQGEALVIAGRPEALAELLPALQAFAAKMPSARQAEIAALFAALAQGELDAALLERQAALEVCVPDLARRARVLLGGTAPLDVLDTRLLEATREATGWRTPELRVPGKRGGWEPGWGIDRPGTSVWLPDGRRIDLGRRVALRDLLDALAEGMLEGPGGLGKEALLRRVWNERAYHPLRHDNRLHAAVSKLRRLLGERPERPRWILTTPEGYALGGPLRIISHQNH